MSGAVRKWRIGDHVIVALRNQHERRRIDTDVLGVVAAIDLPHAQPGVRVTFIDPKEFNGLNGCYATHAELRRAP